MSRGSKSRQGDQGSGVAIAGQCFFCRCDWLWGRAQTQMVGSRQWKSDLRLNGKGKEGSRELATALFPASASMLRYGPCV